MCGAGMSGGSAGGTSTRDRQLARERAEFVEVNADAMTLPWRALVSAPDVISDEAERCLRLGRGRWARIHPACDERVYHAMLHVDPRERQRRQQAATGRLLTYLGDLKVAYQRHAVHDIVDLRKPLRAELRTLRAALTCAWERNEPGAGPQPDLPSLLPPLIKEFVVDADSGHYHVVDKAHQTLAWAAAMERWLQQRNIPSVGPRLWNWGCLPNFAPQPLDALLWQKEWHKAQKQRDVGENALLCARHKALGRVYQILQPAPRLSWRQEVAGFLGLSGAPVVDRLDRAVLELRSTLIALHGNHVELPPRREQVGALGAFLIDQDEQWIETIRRTLPPPPHFHTHGAPRG